MTYSKQQKMKILCAYRVIINNSLIAWPQIFNCWLFLQFQIISFYPYMMIFSFLIYSHVHECAHHSRKHLRIDKSNTEENAAKKVCYGDRNAICVDKTRNTVTNNNKLADYAGINGCNSTNFSIDKTESILAKNPKTAHFRHEQAFFDPQNQTKSQTENSCFENVCGKNLIGSESSLFEHDLSSAYEKQNRTTVKSQDLSNQTTPAFSSLQSDDIYTPSYKTGASQNDSGLAPGLQNSSNKDPCDILSNTPVVFSVGQDEEESENLGIFAFFDQSRLDGGFGDNEQSSLPENLNKSHNVSSIDSDKNLNTSVLVEIGGKTNDSLQHNNAEFADGLHGSLTHNPCDILSNMPVVSSVGQDAKEHENLGIFELFDQSRLDGEFSDNEQSSLPENLNKYCKASSTDSDKNLNTSVLVEIDGINNTDSCQSQLNSLQCKTKTYRFLSFGVINSLKVTSKDDVEKTKDHGTKDALLDDTTKKATTKPDLNLGHSTFCHEIQFEDACIGDFEAKVVKKMLFGDTQALFTKVTKYMTNFDKFIEGYSKKESVYAVVEKLDVKAYSCKNMHDFYFLFMIHTCLNYVEELNCYVLRDELWGTHVFMAEFYPHIAWKLEKLTSNDEMNFDVNDEEEYKKSIKEELKLLCIILELYKGIDAKNDGLPTDENLLALINYHIEKLRNVIQMHLVLFYEESFATVLFYSANNSANSTVLAKDVNKFLRLGIENDFLVSLMDSIVKKSEGHVHHRVKKRFSRKCTNLHFYEDIHTIKMVKNIIFILAFTLNNNCVNATKYQLCQFRKIENLKELCKKTASSGAKDLLHTKKLMDSNINRSVFLNASKIFDDYIFARSQYRSEIKKTMITFLKIISVITRQNARVFNCSDKMLSLKDILDRQFVQKDMTDQIELFTYHELFLKIIEAKRPKVT